MAMAARMVIAALFKNMIVIRYCGEQMKQQITVAYLAILIYYIMEN